MSWLKKAASKCPREWWCKLSFALILVSLSAWVQAWSGYIHTDISEAAFSLLTKKEQNYYNKLASQLKHPRLASGQTLAFTDLSRWVDSVRSEPVKALFGTHVPKSLRNFAAYPTHRWHYDNQTYTKPLQTIRCQQKNAGKLEHAWRAVHRALATVKSQEHEAILLAFAIHLLDDAHQPLHTATLQRSDCSIDRGGNRYCLVTHAGRCALNLHQLWDRGFRINIKSEVVEELGMPLDLAFDPEVEMRKTLFESRQLLPLVYSIEENISPSGRYIERACKATKRRFTSNVDRVLRLLKTHYARQQL